MIFSAARRCATACAGRATRLSATPVLRAARPSRKMATDVKAFKEGTANVQDVQKVAEPRVKVGDKIPMEHKVFIFEEGADAPREIAIGEIFAGKKGVLFGLPGAFTSVCSSKHVPEYNQKRGMLVEQGVEVIACISVNDAYVMRQWAKDLGIDPAVIKMLGDGDASFHEAVGLTQVLPGLGERSRRYSMYLEDGVIKVLNIDEPGGKSYKVSGPSYMTEELKKLHGKA